MQTNTMQPKNRRYNSGGVVVIFVVLLLLLCIVVVGMGLFAVNFLSNYSTGGFWSGEPEARSGTERASTSTLSRATTTYSYSSYSRTSSLGVHSAGRNERYYVADLPISFELPFGWSVKDTYVQDEYTDKQLSEAEMLRIYDAEDRYHLDISFTNKGFEKDLVATKFTKTLESDRLQSVETIELAGTGKFTTIEVYYGRVTPNTLGAAALYLTEPGKYISFKLDRLEEPAGVYKSTLISVYGHV